MSTSKPEDQIRSASVLVVGVGGLGCPAALALVRAGVGRVVLADDDLVDESNLHRQILFSDSDIGKDKLIAAHAALTRAAQDAGSKTHIELVRRRFLPDDARAMTRDVNVVVEGSDNFATKFLAADACRLESRPVVHASAVRFRATVWAVSAKGAPCYRCLFEDLPHGEAQPNCAEAGVLGPVPGFAGALQADLALRLLTGDEDAVGAVYTFDGWKDALRRVPVSSRPDCALCGNARSIFEIDETRYTGTSCAA